LNNRSKSKSKSTFLIFRSPNPTNLFRGSGKFENSRKGLIFSDSQFFILFNSNHRFGVLGLNGKFLFKSVYARRGLGNVKKNWNIGWERRSGDIGVSFHLNHEHGSGGRGITEGGGIKSELDFFGFGSTI